MCNFLSAIVTKENLYVHDMLDSHEDIIDFFELRDDPNLICRVEYRPDDSCDLAEIEKYVLRVDQESAPDWWESRKEHIESALRGNVKARIVTTKRKLLTAGAWILKDAIVDKLVSAKIVAMCGSSEVGAMSLRQGSRVK